MTPLEAYIDAFSRYLRTGTVGALADFCDDRTDLDRLKVYRNGSFKACVEALRSNYPLVERLIGAGCFAALARRYIEPHPPRVATLVGYGEHFPQCIEDARDIHQLDYLASFAMLDRAWTEVYFAADADPAGTSVPADLDDHPEAILNLRCRLAPGVRLVSLNHAVLGVWAQLRRGSLEQPTTIQAIPQHILIWRSEPEILHRELKGPEHTFIARIAAGQPCGEAAGTAINLDPTFDLVAIFASLLHYRVLLFEP